MWTLLVERTLDGLWVYYRFVNAHAYGFCFDFVEVELQNLKFYTGMKTFYKKTYNFWVIDCLNTVFYQRYEKDYFYHFIFPIL